MGQLSIFQIIVLAAFLAAYLIPTFVALGRKKQNALAIAALNVVLGWTLVGWAGALVWACLKDKGQEASGY